MVERQREATSIKMSSHFSVFGGSPFGVTGSGGGHSISLVYSAFEVLMVLQVAGVLLVVVILLGQSSQSL